MKQGTLPGLPPTSLVPEQTKLQKGVKGEKRQRSESAAEKELGKKYASFDYRCAPADAVETLFRHSGWHCERERVAKALTAANVPEARRQRFGDCGSEAVVQWSPERSRHRVRANYCGDRFCVPCSRARSHKARGKLHALCEGHSPLFITLTLRASAEPLNDLLDHLLKSFAKLRRHVLWKHAVSAGAYVIEVKKGAGSNRWHPHIHVLAIGGFIPQVRLSEAWNEASGGSFVVDVQRVWEDDRAVGYVGKYVSKGWSAEVARDPDSLIECILAMRGRRLLGTFGKWRNVDLEGDDHGPDDWVRVGRLVSVHEAYQRGELWARGVVRSLMGNHDENSITERPAWLDRPPSGS
jgi:hypothetical protein